jgi:pimeloyl-ACP methyl ester carboxylesterase
MEKAHQRTALSTGVELDVWTLGDPANPPIIFLHGFPESHRTWANQMAGLAERFWCIAPDQRGYARSSKPAEVSDYMVPKLVGDVFALADALGIERFTIAAHDWGGAIGWAAAITRPERVERLIIANAPHPHIFQKTIIEDLAQRQASQYIRNFRGDELEQRIAENGVDWFFDHSFMRYLEAGAVSAEDRAAYIDEWSQPGALTAMFNWYRASPIDVPAMDAVIETTDYLQKPFPKMMLPTLIIWGMKDPALLPCQLEGIEDYVPNLTVVRIDDAGHFSPWEAPDAVTKAMREWLIPTCIDPDP